jgi:hypothetical protein
MQSRRRTTAIALTGAVALASAGYGIGSQAGGGSAVADSNGARAGDDGRRGFHRELAPPFDDLAGKLGVDADKLATAFRDFHGDQAGERHDWFAGALADALGKSVEDVTAALDRIHQRHEDRFADRIAKKLGVEASKVRAALEDVTGDGPPPPPDELVATLADKLGKSESAVRRALFQGRMVRMHVHRPDSQLRDLAAALDVTRSELRKALRELHAGDRERFEEHDSELAQFLADRFDLDVSKVEDALADLPRPAPHPGGGRPGPGGPGAFGRPL